MDGSLNWKMTVVGGGDNGRDFVFAADARVTVGRSRDTCLRIAKSDTDVSGHHVEFLLENGRPMVRNVSHNPQTKVNDVKLPPGEQVEVVRGIEVALGETVRIRLDEVPMADLETTTGAAAGETTQATNVPLTAETRWQGRGGLADEPTAVLEEAPLTETVATERNSTPTPTDAHPTAIDQFDGLNADSSGGGAETGDGETESRDLNTVAPDDPETPLIDEASLQELRRAEERRRRLRRVMVGFSLGVVASCLVGLWFVSRNTREVDRTTIVDGVERFALRNTAGRKLLEVDYPAAPKRSVTPSPDNSGVTVISYQGRDRDVPFFLQLETRSHPDELKIDLLTSVRRWLDRTASSGEGIVFDERTRAEIKIQFVEDVYPESCEKASLYGVRFVEFEYKRTWSDNTVWHGCAIYLRRGDAVHLLRREIPDALWDRGGYRLKADPNLAVYADFASAYWESPGEAQMPVERKTTELMENVRSALAKERAADWRFVKRDIDALLARSWRTDPKTRDLAMSFLRQFRERMEHFYWKEYNALQVARETADREPKMMRKMTRIRQDAQMIFNDPGERYYNLVNSGGVW